MAIMPIRRNKNIHEINRIITPWASYIIEAKVITLDMAKFYGMLIIFKDGIKAN